MEEQHDNQKHSPPSTAQAAKPARKRRHDLSDIPVEIVQAKGCNPANPYNYLSPTERAERIAQLWHNLFQSLEPKTAKPDGQ